MELYDSLSTKRQKLSKEKVNMYLCGPTVYNYIHLGNARPAITIDFLHRFLIAQGKHVNFLQNITDIDDKIIKKAMQEELSEKELADFYTEAYLNNLDQLGVLRPTTIAPISEHLEKMIHFIEKLVASGAAYEMNGNVYFDLEPWKKQYGKLGKKSLDELIAGERVEVVQDKKHPMDFVLWKKTNEGQNWNSPWGRGRPGWHTECVVLVDDYFHDTIDIHAGGVDLKFPHHENERIQFHAKNKKELAKIWMHNGHLNWGTTKMSKSLGNVVLVKDFLETNNPDVLRWIFMSTKYTQPINLNPDLILQGEKFIQKLKNLHKKVLKNEITLTKPNPDFKLEKWSLWTAFVKAMEDDLNTPQVLTNLEKALKVLNQGLDQGYHWEQLKPLSYDFQKVLATLGFTNYFNLTINDRDRRLYQDWQDAMKMKDFEKADALRKILTAKELI